ncbi:MAG TPA: hypothetical protein VFQ20_05520 [Burkholderiaceae bacterium]|nr:hypothetical protein [Burkholderiaceae bacterium]
MLSFLVRAAAVAAFVAAPALAAPRPDPADPAASTPRLEHRSALAGYQRHADTPAADWRSANQLVERIGGWRAYARESAPSASAPSRDAAPGAAAAPARRH